MKRKIFFLILVAALLILIYLYQAGQISVFLDAAYLRFWVKNDLPPIEQSPLHQVPKTSSEWSNLDDLFIIAHYDDEALAIGGFLEAEIQQGKKVGLVIVTFSQGDDSDQRNWYGEKRKFHWWQWKYINDLIIQPQDRTDYANDREQETKRALDYLGLPDANRIFLRYPEQIILAGQDQPDKLIQGDFLDPVSKKVEKYSGKVLKNTIHKLLVQAQPKLVVTHFPDDTNVDHRAIGRLTENIIHQEKLPITIWHFLVHWNNHEAAWAPKQYENEDAWLIVEPIDYFLAPSGSPSQSIDRQENINQLWSSDFNEWKNKLIDFYRSQKKFNPKINQIFNKKNELFWDLENRTLINIVYD